MLDEVDKSVNTAARLLGMYDLLSEGTPFTKKEMAERQKEMKKISIGQITHPSSVGQSIPERIKFLEPWVLCWDHLPERLCISS